LKTKVFEAFLYFLKDPAFILSAARLTAA